MQHLIDISPTILGGPPAARRARDRLAARLLVRVPADDAGPQGRHDRAPPGRRAAWPASGTAARPRRGRTTRTSPGGRAGPGGRGTSRTSCAPAGSAVRSATWTASSPPRGSAARPTRSSAWTLAHRGAPVGPPRRRSGPRSRRAPAAARAFATSATCRRRKAPTSRSRRSPASTRPGRCCRCTGRWRDPGAAVRAAPAAAPHVRWAGAYEAGDLDAILAGADAVVMPSRAPRTTRWSCRRRSAGACRWWSRRPARCPRSSATAWTASCSARPRRDLRRPSRRSRTIPRGWRPGRRGPAGEADGGPRRRRSRTSTRGCAAPRRREDRAGRPQLHRRAPGRDRAVGRDARGRPRRAPRGRGLHDAESEGPVRVIAPRSADSRSRSSAVPASRRRPPAPRPGRGHAGLRGVPGRGTPRPGPRASRDGRERGDAGRHGDARVPWLLQLHDWWYACPRIDLIRKDLSVCETGPRLGLRVHAPLPPVGDPREYAVAPETRGKHSPARRPVRYRYARNRRQLARVPRFVAGSNFLRGRWARLGLDPARVEVIPLGLPPAGPRSPPRGGAPSRSPASGGCRS